MSQRGQAACKAPITGITVREALKLGALRKARVLAGEEGLDNIIRSVSVIEVPDAVRWFQGYELWVTAGYSYRENGEALVQLVEDMVCADAAALAICYSQRYLGGIPEKVIVRADEMKLPLLELPLDVRYVDIITPVMTAVVNRQASYLDRALKAHVQLENSILKGMGLPAMVEGIAQMLGDPIMLLTPSCQVRCRSWPSEEPASLADVDWQRVLNEAQADTDDGNGMMSGEVAGYQFTAAALGTETMRLGYLMGLWTEADETKRLLLMQCSPAVTVELLLERTKRESELRIQRDFFDDLFEGKMSSSLTLRRAHAQELDLSGCSRVVLADLDFLDRQFLGGQEAALQELKSALKKLAATLVEAEPGGGLAVSRSDSVVLLPRYPGSGRQETLAWAKSLAQKVCREAAQRLPPATVSVGVGVFCDEPTDLARGFHTAHEAVEIGRRLGGPSSVQCWEELGPYQLLFRMKGSGEASAFVAQSLGPLLQDGSPRAGELLSTLDMLLACGGNGEKAAALLHLHRNTVRYRLEQICRLLGRNPLDSPFETQLALALQKLL